MADHAIVAFTCLKIYLPVAARSTLALVKDCRPLFPLPPTSRPAAMFVLFVLGTRIFQAKAVNVVLGSSYLSARKIVQPFTCNLNTEIIWCSLHVNNP